MKLLAAIFCGLLAVTVCYAQSDEALDCDEIKNCGTCQNQGPICTGCGIGRALKKDNKTCETCSNCLVCVRDDNDVVSCNQCIPGYYADATGTCVSCGAGCLECAMNENGLAVCSQCISIGYTMNEEADDKACVQCSSNCKTCSLVDPKIDLSTTCTACIDEIDNVRGYFLKTKDKTCSQCAANCQKCSDDGSGSPTIDTCFVANYKKVTTNDKTSCIPCPSTCSTCNEEANGNNAVCTQCTAGLGVFLNSQACTQCQINCDTCASLSKCATCNEGYYLESSGACSACQTRCDKCKLEDKSEVCEECESGYGTKAAETLTCDDCGLSRCTDCSRNGDSSFSCSACETGYGLDGTGKCVACSTGCTTCGWVTDKMVCTDCQSDYGLLADDDLCYPCSAVDKCIECTVAAGPVETCTKCVDTHYLSSNGGNAHCVSKTSKTNCIDYNSADDTCTACIDGYKVKADGSGCDECTVTNCITCDTDVAQCDACQVNYGLWDKNADNTTDDACDFCLISNCLKCLHNGARMMCTKCKSGFVTYNSAKSSVPQLGTSCLECGDGCATCTVDYTDDSTSCTACNPYSNGEAFVLDGGKCHKCPENCEECSYTTEKTNCNSGKCTVGFTLNDDTGNCDENQPNCLTSVYESGKGIVCSSSQCASGYGNFNDGTCKACPNSCSTCLEENSKMICSVCNSGYALNTALCSKCPSNCEKCVEEDGSMICESCNDRYALDSGLCIPCSDANCETCTANDGKTTCTDCNDGYALSREKTCIVCSTAAFTNCIRCGDISAETNKAECEACNSGYVLKDDDPSSECVATSGLTCSAMYMQDPPLECTLCDGENSVVDGKCAIMCTVCGTLGESIATTEFVPRDECKYSADNNSTDTAGFAKIEPCFTGECFSFLDKDADTIVSGCNPKDPAPTNELLQGECKDFEFCEEVNDKKYCRKCCVQDYCGEEGVIDGDSGVDRIMSLSLGSMLIIALLPIFNF